MTAGPHVQAFDLNIVTVLKHWSLAFAIREIIANALDALNITGTPEPVIEKVEDSAILRVTQVGPWTPNWTGRTSNCMRAGFCRPTTRSCS